MSVNYGPKRTEQPFNEVVFDELIDDNLVVGGGKPWFDVTHPTFGAAGDGITDDTAAIQAALNACGAAGGGTVFFPSGTYKFTVNLTPLSGTKLLGGPNAVLAARDDGTGNSIVLFLNTVTDVVVEALIFSPTNVTGRTGNFGPIRATGCTRLRILRNRITGSSGVGIYVANSTAVLIEGNEVYGTYADGIHVNRQSTDIRIIGNYVSDTGDDGIAVISNTDPGGTWSVTTDVTVAGNTVKNLSTTRPGHGQSSGIKVIASNATVTGNTCDGIPTFGILVCNDAAGALSGTTQRYAVGVAIVGNVVQNYGTLAAGAGIGVANARAVVIVGNTIDNAVNGTSGITLTGVFVEVLIEANRVSRTGGRGITALQTTSADARLILELFTNQGDAGVITASCSALTIRGNRIRNVTSHTIHCVGGATPATDLVIAGNLVQLNDSGAALDGIRVEQWNRVNVTGNELSVYSTIATDFTIFLLSVTDFTVSANTAHGTASVGIRLQTDTSGAVVGNTMNAMTTYGISITADCSGILVANNTVLGNGTAGILPNTGPNVIRGNQGYNPVGTVATPGFPATTVGQQNTTGVDVRASIVNGVNPMTYTLSGSAGTPGSRTIPAGAYAEVIIPAGQTFTPTYAGGAPVWSWYGL